MTALNRLFRLESDEGVDVGIRLDSVQSVARTIEASEHPQISEYFTKADIAPQSYNDRFGHKFDFTGREQAIAVVKIQFSKKILDAYDVDCRSDPKYRSLAGYMEVVLTRKVLDLKT